ncbi:MAG: fibronectin type III domain-containing protein [Candidatus Falkowbacteria bacterium]
MKKISVILIFFLALGSFFAMGANAADVTLAWDANSPDPQGREIGYRIFIRSAGANYNYSDPRWEGTPTTCTIPNLDENNTYFFVCRAYVVGTSEQSGDSNEVMLGTAPVNTLNDSYESYLTGTDPDNDGINHSLRVININVETEPIDPKEVYWKKTGINANVGQVLLVEFDVKFTDLAGADSLISLRIEDEDGVSHSTERTVFVNSEWKRHSIEIVLRDPVMAAELKVYCGQAAGSYEFTNIAIAAQSPIVEPIMHAYLQRLEASTVGNRYKAIFGWIPPAESDGVIFRVARTLEDLESPDGAAFIDTLLPAGTTEYAVEINAAVAMYGGINLFTGVFISVSNMVDGLESAPYITCHLPGNTQGTVDDPIPPLFSEIKVDALDITYVQDGYYYNTHPVPTPGDSPAGPEERGDIDNRLGAGKVLDWSFARSQNNKMFILSMP